MISQSINAWECCHASRYWIANECGLYESQVHYYSEIYVFRLKSCLLRNLKIIQNTKAIVKMIYKIIFLLSLSFNYDKFTANASSYCMPRQTKYGLVCVCTADHCDYLENPQPSSNELVIISSSKVPVIVYVKLKANLNKFSLFFTLPHCYIL